MSDHELQHTGDIVVGVDGSPQSREAFRYAADLARSLHTKLVAVGTWQTPQAGYGAAVLTDWSPEEDVRAVLHDACADVFPDGQPSWFRTKVVNGPPARSLIEASEDAVMLVVGSRGHGGFAGLLLGSVSSACAEYATCPVLVHHDGPRGRARGARTADVHRA
ncbi:MULTISPECIES: universal stress protein [unclassified Curtobacterium]|uniref:universal stress protein n=1 Tax=unclassified Curtobacterium TaxID=257496 RepID=UPI000DAA8577|nr:MULTISPECIES: universal stress protein [unclassified Curtobacterium]PZE27350.1 universal stress protein [Curtobacterium sp. MCBD17_028]PZF61719.1 universal stress protein [Curtobacterium sp. MCBD17_013]WIB63450.1 universal stress protein [Curtobacterium sp. MCBD17_040]WIE54469.1 universal stress protein [Curtobacterium sp. MCBD17_003]